jgi:hypothetical protein
MTSSTRLFPARLASTLSSPLLCGALLLAIAAACGGAGGGGGDTVTGPKLVNTGPGTTGAPDVSGVYMRVDNAAASTCTPQDLPAGGGTVRLQAFVDSSQVRLYQNGTRIQLAYLSYPDQEADTGTVDLSGKIAMGITGTGSKENLRAGTRQFYVDMKGTFNLTRSDASSPFQATGNYTYVYHEDAATAPVYATCTRTIAITFTKAG